MPILETDHTVHFAIEREGPEFDDTTTKCTGVFRHALNEFGDGKKVMVTFDEFRDHIGIDVEAGNNAIAALFTVEQAEALVKELKLQIAKARK